MSNTDTQLYLRLFSSPSSPLASSLGPLEKALAKHPYACVRVALTQDADQKDALSRVKDLCDARDIPLVLGGVADLAIEMAQRIVADGVHLRDSPGLAAQARKQLGKDAILGIATGSERHAAMSAAEAGADYVALSPKWDGNTVPDFVRFWNETIEIPAVIENAPSDAARQALMGIADFIAVDLEAEPR